MLLLQKQAEQMLLKEMFRKKRSVFSSFTSLSADRTNNITNKCYEVSSGSNVWLNELEQTLK